MAEPLDWPGEYRWRLEGFRTQRMAFAFFIQFRPSFVVSIYFGPWCFGGGRLWTHPDGLSTYTTGKETPDADPDRPDP